MSEEVKDQIEMTENKEDAVLNALVKKQKFRKRITSLFVLGVAIALIVTLIVLSSIGVTVKYPFLSQTKPESIQVVVDGESRTYTKEHDSFEGIYAKYEQAFSMPYLTALFTAQTGSYNLQASEDGSELASESALPTNLGTNYIKVHFDQDQTIFNADGSVYKSIVMPATEKLTYRDFYFKLQEENGFEDVQILIAVKGNTTNETHRRVMTVEFRVNLYSFSQYVKDLAK